jgi:predicted dehydrogenase
VFDVTFNNRRREENLWLTERATSGVLGAIELIDIEWLRTKRQPLQPWLTKKALAGGGVMADLGSHMIITALAMLPARRTFRAQCHSRSYGSAGSDVEDLANAVIAVDGETVVNVRVGWDMHLPKSTQVNIAVYGRNGSARNSDFDGAKSDGYGCIFEDFLGAIDGGPRPDLGLVDDTMNALAALYQSAARNGEPVDGTFQAGR